MARAPQHISVTKILQEIKYWRLFDFVTNSLTTTQTSLLWTICLQCCYVSVMLRSNKILKLENCVRLKSVNVSTLVLSLLSQLYNSTNLVSRNTKRKWFPSGGEDGGFKSVSGRLIIEQFLFTKIPRPGGSR